MRRRILQAADLYCGAGGTSSGLAQACAEMGLNLKLVAINHWDIAIDTHSTNHPQAAHLCENLDYVDPRQVVPSGKLDLLVASPECTFHSVARGGKPVNDQSRASAWRIIEWLSRLTVQNVLIENVPEFTRWGPLIKKRVERDISFAFPLAPFDQWFLKMQRQGGTQAEWKRIYRKLSLLDQGKRREKHKATITVEVPDPKRKGEIFLAFLKAIESHGYTVDHRVLCCADFGDPTSRKRLFIIARLGKKRIVWPEATHAPKSEVVKHSLSLFSRHKLRPHRTASEIIDWSIEGESIFRRKQPLAPNTVARIFAGLRKFCSLPFIIPKEGNGSVRDVRRPLQTITADARGIGLVEPYLVTTGGRETAPRSIDEPVRTLLTREHNALIQPFIVVFRNNQDADSLDRPLNTICTTEKHALCEPYIVVLRNNNRARGLDEPLSPVLTSGAHHGIAQAFLIGAGGPQGAGAPRGVDEPVRTLLKQNHQALIQPFVIGQQSGAAPRTTEEPLPTVATQGAISLVQPLIVKISHTQSNGHCYPTDQPLTTITGKQEHALVQPFLVSYHGNHNGRADGERRVKSLDDTIPTLDTSNRYALVIPQLQPFTVKYNRTGGANPVDVPLDTISTKDRFGLVEPQLIDCSGQGACQCGIIGEVVGMLDIRFRMLQPHELSAAMGFSRSYVFVGNREQVVRQIGNAVPVNTSTALCKTLLSAGRAQVRA